MKIFDYYKEIQSEAAQLAYGSTCQFITIKNENPQPHGCGVFVEIDGEHFMITAAHVIENKENEVYVRIGEHELLTLGGEYTKNVTTDKRDEDKIDIAILKLSQETVANLGDKFIFLKQNELGINHVFQNKPMYTSVGFPATKSKYNSYKKELKSKSFTYTTMPAQEEIYSELKCEKHINIIVHYDKKKVMDYSTGQFNTGPDPYGISGSGLWFTPIQEKASNEVIEKKLVAIMTEWAQENKKYWIGTRIDLITELIRKKYNMKLETSKIVKINV